MRKEPQDAGQDVANVVEELHVHDHGLVSPDEGPTVAHEAHHKHNLVCQLGNNHKKQSRSKRVSSLSKPYSTTSQHHSAVMARD